MNKFLRITLISTAVSTALYFGSALIMTFWPAPTFETDPFPVTQQADVDFTPQQYTARDGETLFARQFPANSDDTILLIHGVTSDSSAFNSTAPQLQQMSGAEVIALDLRGHGQSGGTVGDVDYIGQYQDDVADVIAAIRAEDPNGRIILAGHSMGGGVGLQFTQLEDAPEVDGYLFFAPHLGTNSPTVMQPNPEATEAEKEAAAAYSQLHIPRLIGLIMLERVGIKLFGHLDTLFFNLADDVTHTYSFRATANAAPQDYVSALTAVNAPMLVIVGSNDEAFVAAEYPTAVSEYSNGEVHIIDGENHNSILSSEPAMTIIESWLDETELASSN